MPPLKNRKHELLAQNVVAENFNATRAYAKTYPNASYETANSAACVIVNSSEVKNRIDEIAQRKKFTIEYHIETLAQALQAKKSAFANGKWYPSEEADWASRIESAKIGLKLFGYLSGESLNVDARSVNIGLDSESIKRLNSTLAELKSLAGGSASDPSPAQLPHSEAT